MRAALKRRSCGSLVRFETPEGSYQLGVAVGTRHFEQNDGRIGGNLKKTQLQAIKNHNKKLLELPVINFKAYYTNELVLSHRRSL